MESKSIPFATVAQKGNRVIVKFVGKPKHVDDIMDYLNKIKQIYDKNEKFIILYNALYVGALSMKNLKVQADFMRKYEEKTKRLMVRAAVVVNGKAQKLMLQSLFKFKKPACPLKVFDSVNKATDYLRQAPLAKVPDL